MRRNHRLLAMTASGVVALVAAAGATAALTGTIRTRGPATVEVDFTTSWTAGVYTNVDLGEEGIGPGDLTLATEVPMVGNKGDVGTLEGIETIMSAAFDGTVSQELTLRLDGGQVMVAGVVRHDKVPYDLAVVGGTGRYLKARGALTFVGDDEQRKVSVWSLTVTR